MRSPALAIAWELYRRHRWVPWAWTGYVLLVVAWKLLIAGPSCTLALDPPDGTAVVVITPSLALFLTFLAAFSYGFDGDLIGRRSLYPARALTLPVGNGALAGWPMLWGALAMAALWLTTALLGRWTWSYHLPLIWPALYTASFLSWTQVLAWLPYGVRGMRVIATVLWLSTTNVFVVVAVYFELPEPLLAAFLVPQFPLAFLCARAAVARARRGDVPDWLGALAKLARFARLAPPRRERFLSPAQAQLWFEWRHHGWSLPVWVGIVLLFELVLLIPEHPPVAYLVIAAALTPPFMAAFIAMTERRSAPSARDPYGVTPFLATRPLTCASLARAKLTMAARSTLVTWLLVLSASAAGLAATGNWLVVRAWGEAAAEVFGAPRALALVLLALLGLLLTTWTQLVQGLCIGLTGRGRLIKASVLLRLSLLTVVLPIPRWLLESATARAAFVGALPWMLAALVAIKIAAASWFARRVLRERLLGDRVLVTGAACWLIAVLALCALLAWLFSAPAFLPLYLPALVAIVVVPLARPLALPLALAWNRHRGARRGEPADSTPRSTRRTRVFVAVLALIGLPVVLAGVAAASHVIEQRSSGAIASSHQGRGYLLYVPASYDHTRPTPLVISLHGGGVWPALQMKVSRWNRLADRHGFLVVYPSGSGFPRTWRAQEPGAELEADVRFLAGLIDALAAAYNLDPRRTFADGFSNGGGMAFALSCSLSDRIAAVGMVASAQFLPMSWCSDRRGPPLIAFHGTADRITPYRGGSSWVSPGPFPDIPTWVANRARANGCATTPLELEVTAQVARRDYPGCAGHADVVLYTLEGAGHTWPGGEPLPEWLAGPTRLDVDATGLVWSFFQEHPRQGQ